MPCVVPIQRASASGAVAAAPTEYNTIASNMTTNTDIECFFNFGSSSGSRVPDVGTEFLDSARQLWQMYDRLNATTAGDPNSPETRWLVCLEIILGQLDPGPAPQDLTP